MRNHWFERSYRRILLDMHIPDWDEKFLSKLDPENLVNCYERAGATSVMFPCQSHIGLCYWPTQVGRMHGGIRGEDLVGRTLALLKKRGIAACAYYSVIYNCWAHWEHPEWRIIPCGDRCRDSMLNSRYGICCPNNPEYRDFVECQVGELLQGYDFDGIFIDDAFWPTVCVCPTCRKLYHDETGDEIPTLIDWTSPQWCRFQEEREKWMKSFIRNLSEKAKGLRPDLAIYYNFGCAIYHWTFGAPLDSAVHHDFLGADLYGDSPEQLMVTKLLLNLSQYRPAEFMTSMTTGVREHIQLKSVEQLRLQSHASTLLSSACLFIDWINPDGTINPDVYERVGQVYAETAQYESYLGGEPVEDIAIYFSNDSKMSFGENGQLLSEVDPWSYFELPPHIRAVRGACINLQRAHLPFGIITRKQLHDLRRYQVILLPNVLRMDRQEEESFREYVRGGGALYASRYTSLTESQGTRHSDFMLADVFGCHFAADDLGAMAYLKPVDEMVTQSICPQRCMSLSSEFVMFGPQKDRPVVKSLRLNPQTESTILGTLTLPYKSPAPGTI